MRETEKTSAKKTAKQPTPAAGGGPNPSEIPAPEGASGGAKAPRGARPGRKIVVAEGLHPGTLKQMTIRGSISQIRELEARWKADYPATGPGSVAFGTYVVLQALEARAGGEKVATHARDPRDDGSSLIEDRLAALELAGDGAAAKRAAEVLAKTLSAFQQAVAAICDRLDRIEGSCSKLADETSQQRGAGVELAKAARKLGDAAQMFGSAFK